MKDEEAIEILESMISVAYGIKKKRIFTDDEAIEAISIGIRAIKKKTEKDYSHLTREEWDSWSGPGV